MSLRTIIKRVEETISGAANFVGLVYGGIKTTIIATLKSANVNPAIALTKISGTFVSARQSPAISISNKCSGTGQETVNPGIAANTENSGTAVFPQSSAGFEVIHIKTDLTHHSGATSVTQTAESGRTDWDNEENAVGKHDGEVARMEGDLLYIHRGRLDFTMTDMVDKEDLTIQSVKLLYYVYQGGTLLNNGDLRLYWSSDGGTNVNHVVTFTGNVDYRTDPYVLDITEDISDWSDIDDVMAFVGASVDDVAYAVECDAVELEVIATNTELV